MYESYMLNNVFRTSSSRQYSTYELSRSTLPRTISLSSRFTEYYFQPLFTPTETFPNFFEKLSYPKDTSDLLLPNLQSKKQNGEFKRANKAMKSNKRLLKKIESILSFLQASIEESNILLNENKFDSIKLSLKQNSLSRTSLVPEEITKRVTDEGLKLKLNCESISLLNLLNNWTVCYSTHKELIDTLEAYKKLVSKYVRRYYRRESNIDQLRNLLIAAKNEQMERENSINNNKWTEGHEKSVIKKRTVKRKCKCVWTQLSSYFLNFNPEIKRSLKNLEPPFIRSDSNIQFLNMSSINRLGAIAKMLQYCLDNGITVAEFMDDRTYQKIKTRLKRMEETVLTTQPGAIKDIVYCPSLTEIPFLLSLKNENIESIVGILKNSVTLPYNSCISKRREEELKEIADENRSLVAKINERIMHTKEPIVEQVKNEQFTLRIKKRCRKEKKDAKPKKQKLEDSGTDTNTTPKEHSLKTVIQLPFTIDKPKFKVLKLHQESEENGIDNISIKL